MASKLASSKKVKTDQRLDKTNFHSVIRSIRVDNLILLTQLCCSIVVRKGQRTKVGKQQSRSFGGQKRIRADSFVLAEIMLQCFAALKSEEDQMKMKNLCSIEKVKMNALGDSELSNLPIPVPVVLKTFQSGRESGGE